MAFMNTLLLFLHICHHLFEYYYYKYYESTLLFKGIRWKDLVKKIEEKLEKKIYRSNSISSRIDKDRKQ